LEPSQWIESDGNATDDGIFCGYLSDQSNAKRDGDDGWSDCEGQLTDPSGTAGSLSQPSPLLDIQNPPLPKRRKLDILHENPGSANMTSADSRRKWAFVTLKS
jgi:hypothetical protein